MVDRKECGSPGDEGNSEGGAMDAMSSGSARVVGLPTGLQEIASAAACLFLKIAQRRIWNVIKAAVTEYLQACRKPGMWTTQKRYRNDFSLKLRRGGFGMSSRQRSPNVFNRGLWSTAMMRLVQPSLK